MKEITQEIEKYKHNRYMITNTISFNKYSVIFLKYGRSPMTSNYIIDSILRRELRNEKA